MEKLGKKLPTLHTIWVQKIDKNGETTNLTRRTKISFYNEEEAKIYKNYLNRNLTEEEKKQFKYVILVEEGSVFKHADDLICNEKELDILYS